MFKIKLADFLSLPHLWLVADVTVCELNDQKLVSVQKVKYWFARCQKNINRTKIYVGDSISKLQIQVAT
jgi:hypothetical protein